MELGFEGVTLMVGNEKHTCCSDPSMQLSRIFMELGIRSDDGHANDGEPVNRSMHEESQIVEQILEACR